MSGIADRPSVLIVGGSLAGLFTANLLGPLGWQVEVIERSPHDLDSRGGGIVLQPEVVEVFRRLEIDVAHEALGVASGFRIVLRPDGTIQSKAWAPQTQTSWSFIYATLRRAFGAEGYHQGRSLVRVEQDRAASRVVAHLDDGSTRHVDLLVGADGGNSTVRGQVWPNERPRYAGYLAWRGLLPESDMTPAAAMLHGNFGFANAAGSHILGYLVPGDGADMRAGHRLYNWVWYRVAPEVLLQEILIDATGARRVSAVPEGLLAPRWIDHLRDEADRLLPPAFRAVVRATGQPFMQTIRDLAADRMVDGRIIMLGDAASIPRPHTAASSSKAAADALELADALTAAPDIDTALARWEPAQVALGKALLARGRAIGNELLLRA